MEDDTPSRHQNTKQQQRAAPVAGGPGQQAVPRPRAEQVVSLCPSLCLVSHSLSKYIGPCILYAHVLCGRTLDTLQGNHRAQPTGPPHTTHNTHDTLTVTHTLKSERDPTGAAASIRHDSCSSPFNGVDSNPVICVVTRASPCHMDRRLTRLSRRPSSYGPPFWPSCLVCPGLRRSAS